MEIIVLLIIVFMSGFTGYNINRWVRMSKERKSNKEFYTPYKEAKIENGIWEWLDINDLNTQVPPRGSVMEFITLEDLLKRAIEEENYENASKLRDAIEKQKNNKSNELQ